MSRVRVKYYNTLVNVDCACANISVRRPLPNLLRMSTITKQIKQAEHPLPLSVYTANGQTQPPKPYVIFSLGQPWGAERPLSKNLVTVVVTYCKALNELRVRNTPIHDELLFEAQEAKDIRIIAPTQGDLEAEEFLNPGGNPSTPN